MVQNIFTTGQVAKICNVFPRTVCKWFDSGRLRGYRIPGSQDRRIPRVQLQRFLWEHGLVIPPELHDPTAPDLEGRLRQAEALLKRAYNGMQKEHWAEGESEAQVCQAIRDFLDDSPSA